MTRLKISSGPKARPDMTRFVWASLTKFMTVVSDAFPSNRIRKLTAVGSDSCSVRGRTMLCTWVWQFRFSVRVVLARFLGMVRTVLC